MLNYSEKNPRPLNSGKFLALGFALLILTGTLLLMLPASSVSAPLPLQDALFTATSAVCVTGLTVITPAAVLSRFGQTVLMCLIQVGGLGFLTFSTLLFLIMGKRITLKERLVIQESMNSDRLNGAVQLLEWVSLLTLCIELTGAAVLAVRFVPRFGWGDGIFLSIFHAVSAFCNAGFDLLGASSLEGVQNDPLILMTLATLITLGGMGFALLADVIHSRRFSRMTVHTRLVLIMTGMLTLGGALLILGLEWNNPATLGGMESKWMRMVNALFQSVSLRTAGFAALDQAALRPATKYMSLTLMFIGAGPASTGGGVKLTTFASLMLLMGSIVRGREYAVIFRHTISRKQMDRAMCVLLIALAIVMLDGTVLMTLEPSLPAIDVIYESVSAFATVGLSCGLTPALSLPSRLILILTMFVGRLGPLTLALALAGRQTGSKDKLRYPEANIMIG